MEVVTSSYHEAMEGVVPAAALARLLDLPEEEGGRVLEALLDLLEGGSGGEALAQLPEEARRKLYDLQEFFLYAGGEAWKARLEALRCAWEWTQGSTARP